MRALSPPNSSTITVGGNWNTSGGTGWTPGTSTVDLTGTSNLSQYQTTPWTYGFYILKVAASGFTTTLTTSQNWTKYLTVGSGTLTDGVNSYDIYLHGFGNVFTDGGATITVASFYYRGGANNSQNVVSRDYSSITNLYFNGVGGTTGNSTYSMQGAITATNISVYSNNTDTQTNVSVLNTNNYGITASSTSIGRGVNTDYGKLNAGSSVLDINGNVTIYASDTYGANEIDAGSSTWNITGNFTNNDVFTPGTSNINLTGTTQQTITTNSQSFNNLTLNNTGTDGTANRPLSKVLNLIIMEASY